MPCFTKAKTFCGLKILIRYFIRSLKQVWKDTTRQAAVFESKGLHSIFRARRIALSQVDFNFLQNLTWLQLEQIVKFQVQLFQRL